MFCVSILFGLLIKLKKLILIGVFYGSFCFFLAKDAMSFGKIQIS